jgi:hypothetical protein
MGVMDNEAELWQRARQDDGWAFAQIFDLHRDRIHGRALSLMGNVHDAGARHATDGYSSPFHTRSLSWVITRSKRKRV